MVYYEDNQWHLCTEKVRYVQRNKEIEQSVEAERHQWWLDFEHKWSHTEILEFTPIEPTEEQLIRFNEISQFNIPEGFGVELSKYVENGVFPEGVNHILRQLQLKKEQLQQDEYLIDLDFRLSLSELGV